eukprot:NODE_447_length_8464_cov_0.381112.p8 type:complete len:151 gc:universal NODE_447_length_8464_cov_0.381112:7378-6926(-)
MSMATVECAFQTCPYLPCPMHNSRLYFLPKALADSSIVTGLTSGDLGVTLESFLMITSSSVKGLYSWDSKTCSFSAWHLTASVNSTFCFLKIGDSVTIDLLLLFLLFIVFSGCSTTVLSESFLFILKALNFFGLLLNLGTFLGFCFISSL